MCGGIKAANVAELCWIGDGGLCVVSRLRPRRCIDCKQSNDVYVNYDGGFR